ncbi:hypothetical protein ACFLUO_02815 [Chloroflexota bacterium]
MAYLEKIRKRALQLRKSDKNLSAQNIADILCKEFPFPEIDPDKFSSRTVQYWLNEDKDIAAYPLAEEVKEHDRAVFKKLDRITNHQKFWEYFEKLRRGYDFPGKTADNLAKYYYYIQFEDYRYVSKNLQKLHEHFIKCLSDLGEFMFPHTFAMDGDKDWVKIHYPKPGDEHWRGYPEDELQQMFVEFDSKFRKLTDDADKAYRAYRAAIKNTLLV